MLEERRKTHYQPHRNVDPGLFVLLVCFKRKGRVEIDEHAGPRSSNALCQWSPIGFKRTVNDAEPTMLDARFGTTDPPSRRSENLPATSDLRKRLTHRTDNQKTALQVDTFLILYSICEGLKHAPSVCINI
jgi:hypothetical protein